MGWRTVSSVQELKGLGKLREVSVLVAQDLGVGKVPKGSWQALFQFIMAYRTTEPTFQIKSWHKVQSLEELKQLGSLRAVSESVQKENEQLKIIKNSWKGLWDQIQQLNKIAPKPYASNYFKDEASEIIFYLLELEGEVRLEKLGITKLHYSYKKYANEWRNHLIKLIHPDECTHVKAQEATMELNKIYKEMIQYAK